MGDVLTLAARHPGGEWLLFYLADRFECVVDLGRADPAGSRKAFWIDPRSGEQAEADAAAHGPLSDRSLVAHGVHLPPADREILATSGAFARFLQAGNGLVQRSFGAVERGASADLGARIRAPGAQPITPRPLRSRAASCGP